MKINISTITKGFMAGFIATLVLSLLMIGKKEMGMMPELNAIKMLTMMAHQKLGLPLLPIIGWAMHFIIGTFIWGGLFALFNNIIPAHYQIIKGIIFGVIAWILMMIGPMPMSGAGLFGLNLGVMAPVMTLILHIIFGFVLGGVFSLLNKKYCCQGISIDDKK